MTDTIRKSRLAEVGTKRDRAELNRKLSEYQVKAKAMLHSINVAMTSQSIYHKEVVIRDCEELVTWRR